MHSHSHSSCSRIIRLERICIYIYKKERIELNIGKSQKSKNENFILKEEKNRKETSNFTSSGSFFWCAFFFFFMFFCVEKKTLWNALALPCWHSSKAIFTPTFSFSFHSSRASLLYIIHRLYTLYSFYFLSWSYTQRAAPASAYSTHALFMHAPTRSASTSLLVGYFKYSNIYIFLSLMALRCI